MATNTGECSICTNLFKDPRIVGECGHSFCRDCLKTWAGERQPKDKVTCPLCRKSYQLPPTGVDGLTQNRDLAKVVNSAPDDSLRRRKRCVICRDEGKQTFGTLVCSHEESDITMCDEHGLAHAKENCGHKVMAMCLLHWRSLNLLCVTCQEAICFVCEDSLHDGHDLRFYKNVVADRRKELVALTKDAMKEMARMRDEEAKLNKRLSQVKDAKSKKIRKLEKESSKAELENKQKLIAVNTQIQTLREQVRTLEERLHKLKKELKEEQSLKQQMPKRKKEALQNIEEEFKEESQQLEQSYNELKSSAAKLEVTMARCETLMTGNVFLNTFVSDLEAAKTDLMKLLVGNRSSVDVPGVHDDMGPKDAKDLSVGPAAPVPQYTKLRYLCYLKLNSEFRVDSLAWLSKDVVAACGTHTDGNVYCIYKWYIPSFARKNVYSTNHDIRSITPISDQELIALCKEQPQLRCISVAGQQCISRSLDTRIVNLPKATIVDPQSVRVIGDTIIVSYAFPNHIIVTDWKGTFYQDVQVSYEPWRFTFVPTTRNVIFVGRMSRIAVYHLNNNRLDELVSTDHEHEGFVLSDICSDVAGEVFLLGSIRKELFVYQLLENTSGQKGIVLKKVRFNDFAMNSDHPPVCAFSNEKLAIGRDYKLQLFVCTTGTC